MKKVFIIFTTLLFALLITPQQSLATTYGTCTGSTGQGTCVTSVPSGNVVFYQEATPNNQCAINGTNASLARGTAIYCCSKNASPSYGTCTGSTGQGYCDLTNGSACGTVFYSSNTAKTQCAINGLNAGLPRNTMMYCVCDPTRQTCPQNTPTPTPTSGPQNTPTPTPTSAPVPHTFLNVAAKLPGIGTGGNLSPKHPTRTAHISIYAKNVDPTQPNVTPVYDNKNVSILFNSNNGFFLNSKVDIGTTLPTDSYQIFIKTSGYLRKQVLDSQGNKAITITAQTTNQIPSVNLIAGDTALLYNVMDITDFYAITDCYGAKASGSTCKAGNVITDINDDGTIDGVDINYWLLGLQALQQSNNPEGNGDGPTGE
ncbi:MAG TPA: hypothetical protein VFQ63_03120 [Patescibacteria group bacterium]|nr:hypothetical protein [Patescibacteria group bacterium]